MRTAIESAQTNRARVRDLCCGIAPRTAAAIAAITAVVAQWSLTAINATTFGAFAENGAGGNDVVTATADDTEVTSPDNPWTADDVGKIWHQAGAGVAGGTHVSRIAIFNNAGSIELEDASVTTVEPDIDSPAGLACWGYPVNDLSASAVLPTGGKTWRRLDEATGNATIATFTGATRTLSAVDNRTVLRGDRATSQVITLHKSAPEGFAVIVEQLGVGEVSFVTEGGAPVLENRQNHDAIAGQFGGVTLVVTSNSDGVSAVWVMIGDTADSA